MNIEGVHRRFNPLLDEWVLVSPDRTSRPWQGARERPQSAETPKYDPDCYLCPGNTRVGGRANPEYDRTFVFTNDFAALRPVEEHSEVDDGLLVARTEGGTCRVLCFDPRHDLTMSRMSPDDVEAVIDMWQEQVEELGREHGWVQIFENRGSAMGASNPHPHGQVWATETMPGLPAREDRAQRRYVARTGRPLLLDYAMQESGSPRVVVESTDWLAVVPFWAVWPFETLVVPKTHVPSMLDVDGALRRQLAEVLIELLTRYDNLFSVPFPYSMGWHGAPSRARSSHHWQLHAHFDPPLLRSATVRKHMVGYELMSEAQRDITAEEAADRLRATSSVHHLDRED